MGDYKEAENKAMVVLEEDFEFTVYERLEALYLSLHILGDDELLEQSQGKV